MTTNKGPRRQLMGAVGALAAATLVVDILLLAQPLYMLQVYDRVLPSRSVETLLYISLMAVLALVLLAVGRTARSMLATRVSTRLGVEGGTKSFLASVRLGRGDMHMTRDLSTIRSFVGGAGLTGLLDLPFAPVFVGLLYLVHPGLFVLTALGGAVLVLLAVVQRRFTADLAAVSGEKSRTASLLLSSFTRASRTIRAMGMEKDVLGAWGEHEARSLDAQDRLARINAVFSGISGSVRIALQFAILGYGGFLVLEGQMTAGMIFASSMISGRALQPIDALVAGWGGLTEARLAWRRLLPVLEAPADRDATRLPEPKGAVLLDRVVVAAGNGPERRAVVKGVTASLPIGSCTAIVGPNGSGKSSLARAVAGAHPVEAGCVRIDGSDISNWNREQIGERTGYVDQNVEILPGSVARNIGRFSPDATDESVIQAAKKAHVHDMIVSLPKGYDTVIGEGGHVLSGGQNQRIALARAFHGSPRLLVLDEPNANLDSEGEKALDAAILQARIDGVTVVLVTQRTGAVKQASHVMIMRDGVMEDFGPNEEVFARLNRNVVPIGGHERQNAAAMREAS